MKNKPKLACLLLLSVGIPTAQASMHIDHLFQDVKKSELQHRGKPVIEATHYRIVKINMHRLYKELKNINNATLNVNDKVFIDLPLPNGGSQQYRIVENHTMSPGLAAKYPDIKTYDGYGLGNSKEYVKLDVTPNGFHAMVLSPGKSAVFIDPLYKANNDYYIIYKKKDFKTQKQMRCSVPGNSSMSSFNYYNKYAGLTDFSTCFLRQYRLAVAATIEYTAYQGGKAQAIAAQVTTINRVNGVYETDIGVTLSIIPTNDQIVFENSYPGGVIAYTSGNEGLMIGENQTNVTHVIGSPNYDIGHVFDQNSENAGLAGLGVVCDGTSKAEGVTGSIAPVGDAFDIDFVAHEMGHQFSATHIQNNDCNREDSTAVEPGSGSTIMGYAGICAPNVQNNSNAYFNGINLEQIGTFVSNDGDACAFKTPIDAAPIVASPADVTIPASTPFALTAVATGPGSNIYTYTWEQQNPEASTQPPVSTATGGPNFRSQPPVLLPTRYFPSLAAIVNNGPFTWEVLSSVSRTMKFRTSVRANTSGGSCNAYQDMNVVIDAGAGPFVLTYPQSAGIQWEGGAQQTVQWNTANTNNAPVNAATVNILLSTDGGLTYPQTLATDVANNGSRAITVPQVNTTTARIMVSASNGSFFNISGNNFSITANTAGIIAPMYTTALRNPMSTTSAFVYYSSLGNVLSTDQLVVNGLGNATAILDLAHNRFVISSITTPRRTDNVTITIVRNSSSARSNPFTVPGILG